MGKKIAVPERNSYIIFYSRGGLSLNFSAGNLLLVDCFQHGTTAFNRRLGVSLTFAELQQYFRFFKFLYKIFNIA